MTSNTQHAADFRLEGKGNVPAKELEHAEKMLDKVLKLVDEPVLSAKALLADRPNNHIDHRCEAEASLRFRGDWVRARTFAPTMTEAIDGLKGKLRSQLRHRADRRRTESIRKATDAGEWRHSSRPTDRPPFFDRPADERELVRHKTFSTPSSTAEEAFWDMTQLDYDFFLFTDEATGADSVVSLGADDVESTVKSVEDAPDLRVDEAIDWLGNFGGGFVFFRNRETGRGCVVYRRYDGHYGLLTPRNQGT